MRILQLVSGVVWALFAVAFLFLAIVDFRVFDLFMMIGCGGVSTVSFLLYKWGFDDRSW